MLMNRWDISDHMSPPAGEFENLSSLKENHCFNFSGGLCVCVRAGAAAKQTHKQKHSCGSTNVVLTTSTEMISTNML